MTDDEVLKCVREYIREADDAKRTRMAKNQANQMAFMDEQDFSHKQEGQSAEYLPKVSTSAEQFSAFIKRSLVQFGQWFSVELNSNLPPLITDANIAALLELYLHNIPVSPSKTTKFESIISDCGKQALFDSLMILKIHGMPIKMRKYSVEKSNIFEIQTGIKVDGPTKLKSEDQSTWRLCIDIVRAEDYYPDPTGRGLYEVHIVERDYYQVLAMAEAGIYDEEAVKKIKEDFRRDESDVRLARTRGQDRSEKPGFRKTIVIAECWGTLIDEDGYAVHENIVCAVANDKYVIRKPEPNPFWHGESPFVTCPLLRVPQSVWHKALYDSATSLNIALNEMFNLMLDGGMAAVWGVKQLRASYLEDPKQVSNGVPQGITLVVNESLPPGEKVLENIANGQVPQDAMAIFEALTSEFNAAALTNDIKLGSLPPHPSTATAVTTADQSQAVTLDSIAADMENDMMEPTLRKAWMTILQHVDDFDSQEIVQTIGKAPAAWLLNLSPAERFEIFANIATFKVNGLSTMLSRTRDFQKTMALMQMVAQNPILLRTFLLNYDEQKLLKQAMKQLNINPDDLARTQDQMAHLPQIIQQSMLLGQAMGVTPGAQQVQDAGGITSAPGGGGMPPMALPGGAADTAQVNQEANPTTGMQPM